MFLFLSHFNGKCSIPLLNTVLYYYLWTIQSAHDAMLLAWLKKCMTFILTENTSDKVKRHKWNTSHVSHVSMEALWLWQRHCRNSEKLHNLSNTTKTVTHSSLSCWSPLALTISMCDIRFYPSKLSSSAEKPSKISVCGRNTVSVWNEHEKFMETKLTLLSSNGTMSKA